MKINPLDKLFVQRPENKSEAIQAPEKSLKEADQIQLASPSGATANKIQELKKLLATEESVRDDKIQEAKQLLQSNMQDRKILESTAQKILTQDIFGD